MITGGVRIVTVRSSFVVVANRLPVDEVTTDEGRQWRRSPGGLVTALHPVLTEHQGTWVGWAGGTSEAAPEPFDLEGIRLHPVPLTADELERYYEGMSNATIWPLYHDAVETPVFKRRWREAYRQVNARFAEAAAGGRRRGRDRLGPGLPAPARAGDAARAPTRPADRVLPAHPVPADRAVHADAVPRRDPARAARRRPGRLPAAAGGAELRPAGPAPARAALRGSGHRRRRPDR